MSPHSAPPQGRSGCLAAAAVAVVALAAVVGAIAGVVRCVHLVLKWAFRGFPADGVPTLPLAVLGGLLAASAAVWGRWRWRRGGRARVLRALGLAPGVRDLARRLDVPAETLRAHVPAYREVRIPKRSGGTRVLHVPDDATKAVQRRILRRLLARLAAHPAAYGFERGRSIAHNAAQHAGRAVVLRFDVEDFFPSTRAGRIEAMFLRLGWDREAAALLTRLTTHAGGLPQGAPTSPRLSNLVNRGLDRDLARRVGPLHGRYTRYADDVTVSFPEDWPGCVERTKARVKDELGRRGYRMHERRKLSVRRRHERQVVTGLVVNERVALPRALRRRLRAARHRLANGRPATWTDAQLRGWEAYERMVREQGAEVPEPWRRAPGAHPPRRRRRPRP